MLFRNVRIRVGLDLLPANLLPSSSGLIDCCRVCTAFMASSGVVKEECFRPLQFPVKVEHEYHATKCVVNGALVVDISSSSSSSGGGAACDARSSHRELENTAGEVTSAPGSKRSSVLNNQGVGPSVKRPRTESLTGPQTSGKGPNTSLPPDFLQPLEEIRQNSFAPRAAMAPPPSVPRPTTQNTLNKPFRQFWKAGDYESDKTGHKSKSGGMDHVRVHPKFLHSNATSHKWALGAVAELLDNALDEVVHGATFVQVDMIRNPKNGEPMLLIEDDGGGMNPDSMRQCMSLGYSAKSKIANTIGQYGNGFKTSTMRLGADVVVFSRCQDNKSLGPTESIGILSYTFLRETGQEDIIVPMIDYEVQPFGLRKLVRSNVEDWNRNMESIKRWSPYATEAELMDHFKGMKKQGTKIIVFNLWEDDQGQLELVFDTNRYDIQVRGVNRDEKHISMAERFPNSRHYLTYQHSLRSYASILYLKLPPGFRMFLRGQEIKHHNLVDDLMFTEVWTYKPVGSDVQRDTGQMKAVVTVGFVKDAKEHIDVQGFNVYHKNRLIKPFWRLWNSAASRGRGIIGVLEANFVEPAHDKQGFERTIVLARLEARLVEMQKQYWSKHCHKVGYVNNTLKGKEGKTADPKAAVEAIQPALVAPLSLAPPARPSTLEASRPAMQAGYTSGNQNAPIPAGLTRSTQLHAQVQLARQEHGVEEVNQLQRQGSSQVVQMQSAPVGVPLQRHSLPTVNRAVAVDSSPSQMAHTQPQERSPGQFHSATPPPAISRVSISQSGGVRRVTPFSGAQALRASQTVATNYVSPAARTMQSTSSDIGGVPNSAQNSSVCNTSSIETGSPQPPGRGVETFRPAVGSPRTILRENVAVQSITSSLPSGGVDSHALGCPNSSMNQVSPSTQDSSMLALERSKSPAGGVEVKEQQLDGHKRQNEFPNAPSCTASRPQLIVQGSVEVSVQGEIHRVEDVCTPIAAHFSGPPHASPGTGTNVAQVGQLPPEQVPLKPSRVTNKESVLGRKSLEDLGRLFAKKAASINMNQGEESKNLMVLESEGTANVRSIVKIGTNTELDAHLVEMEVEVKNLQQRLDALKVERDSLRHQLLEERLRGQQNKQELQRKVEQTWTKVRELEAKNGRLQLIKQGSAD